MGEYTKLFERAAARYPEPELSTEDLSLLGGRKQRNQRIAAGILGLAVFALAAIGLVRLLGSDSVPASEGEDKPAPPDQASEILWPQSSLREAREAQRLADAGDPRAAWQVDPALMSGWAQPTDDTEIASRFLQEELGWQEFRLAVPAPDPDPGASYDNEYIRCAPGGTNPLYPNDPRGGGCAPTMNDGRYERVRLDLGQPVRQDETGIWVVTRWEMIAPFEQVVPLSAIETEALLDGFLQARIAGEGAQEYLGVPEDDVPFLYASNGGTPFERSEFEVVEGPMWPDGPMRLKVRLFSEDGATVVEQFFTVERPGRGLLYESEAAGPEGPIPGTTVNEEAVPVAQSFLGGEVTLDVTYPWQGGTTDDGSIFHLVNDVFEGTLKLLVDPRPIGTGCNEGPPAADANALARSIRSNPDLAVTRTVAVTVGGVDALRMDVVTAARASSCEHPVNSPFVLTDAELPIGYGMRLYLLDLPGGSERILAITIVAPGANFDRAVETATPIVDSIEFHTR